MQHLATSTPTTGRLLNISTLTLCRLLGLEKACIRTVATWAKPCQRTTSRRWQARHTSTTGISRGTRRGIHFYPFFSTFFFIYFFSRGGFRDWDYIHECCTARDDIIPSMGGVLPSTYGGDESMVAHQCHLGGGALQHEFRPAVDDWRAARPHQYHLGQYHLGCTPTPFMLIIVTRIS